MVLSVFPIMFLALLAHAIVRIVAGAFLLSVAWRTARSTEGRRMARILFALLESALGILLCIGYYTQPTALALALSTIVCLLFHKHLPTYVPSRSNCFLLLGISLSLVITGAGAFAIDMPF